MKFVFDSSELCAGLLEPLQRCLAATLDELGLEPSGGLVEDDVSESAESRQRPPDELGPRGTDIHDLAAADGAPAHLAKPDRSTPHRLHMRQRTTQAPAAQEHLGVRDAEPSPVPSTSNTGGIPLQRKEDNSTTNTPPTGQLPAYQPEQAPGHRPTLGHASPPADTSAALRDELDPRGTDIHDLAAVDGVPAHLAKPDRSTPHRLRIRHRTTQAPAAQEHLRIRDAEPSPMPSTSNTGGVSLQRKESDSTTNTPPTGQVPAHQPEQAPGHRPTLGRASPPADTSAALRDELDPRGLEVRDAEPSPAPSTRNTGGILLQRRPIRGTSEFEPMPVGRIAGAANGPRELSESTAPGREFIDMQAPLETPDELGQPESFRAPDVRGPLSIVQANRRALAPLPNTEQHLAYVPTPEALPTDPLDPSIERTLTAVLRNAARRHGIEI